MSRYINADKLHEEVFEETKFKLDPETNDAVKRLTMPISEVLRRINNQPSADVVEVVRCKDCKWGNNKTRSGKRYCELSDMYQVDDGFCNWGEKIK